MKKSILAAAVLLAVAVAGCRMGPKCPYCQSCAMPLEAPESFGTEADGRPSIDYCHFCYQKGAFTEPDISLQQMIDKCVRIMVEKKIMPEAEARALMTKSLPHMRRWKKT